MARRDPPMCPGLRGFPPPRMSGAGTRKSGSPVWRPHALPLLAGESSPQAAFCHVRSASSACRGCADAVWRGLPRTDACSGLAFVHQCVLNTEPSNLGNVGEKELSPYSCHPKTVTIGILVYFLCYFSLCIFQKLYLQLECMLYPAKLS